MKHTEFDPSARLQSPGTAKLDTIGWGVFLVWVGVALLGGVGWPGFFLGAGLIMMGGQAARRVYGIGLDWFVLSLGVCFAVAGGLRVLDVQLGPIVAPAWLVPSAFIAVGVAIVLSAWRKRGP